MEPSPAILVLGMHRSGTSCLAGMLAAGGAARAGPVIRNWDNARGHHEMLALVRLNEAVLAHSGGHWLSAPARVRWTAEHAAARDQLLRSQVEGRPPLLKDPRTLLVLPFWRASSVPYRAIGIVRHPVAVARSLESWREMPLADGVALWSAHNRALAEDRDRHGDPVVCFDAPGAELVAGLRAAWPWLDEAALAAAYEDDLVHHDVADAPAIPGLDQAVALYQELAGTAARTASLPSRGFPHAALAAFRRLLADGAVGEALAHAGAAVAAAADPSAVLVPVVTSLVRRRAHGEALGLLAEHAARLEGGLADLLRAKVLLAAGAAADAASHLEAACAAPDPIFQARALLPQALRAAGRHADARVALGRVVADALYPHRPLATLAEWSWLDGDAAAALAGMERAIEAAPPHRRGRLRTRRAEWLLAQGAREAARAELERAMDEDPGYARSREVLAGLIDR